MTHSPSTPRYPDIAEKLIELAKPDQEIGEHEILFDVDAVRKRSITLLKSCEEMGSAEGKSHVWPSISRVGAEAARAAWLIMLHYDSQPEAQMRIVGLMEEDPTDVPLPHIAALTDRAMMNITRGEGETLGFQMYGTQILFIEDAIGKSARSIFTFPPISINDSINPNRQKRLWRGERFENINLAKLNKRRKTQGLEDFEKFVTRTIRERRTTGERVTPVWDLDTDDQEILEAQLTIQQFKKFTDSPKSSSKPKEED